MSQQNLELVRRVLGDSVVAHIHQWGRGKGSGAKVESQFWLVWTIRDGKIVRGAHYARRADALEAVGIREAGESRAGAEDRPPWETSLRAEDVMRRRLG